MHRCWPWRLGGRGSAERGRAVRRRQRDKRPRLLACGVVAAALLLAGLLEGCGVTAHKSSQSKEEQEFQKSLKAAACMRANGVPNYPDPKLIDGSIYRNLNPSLNINPSSPAFQQAAKKCTPDSRSWSDQAEPHRRADGNRHEPITAALLAGALSRAAAAPAGAA